MARLSKADIVEQIAKGAEITKVAAEKAVNTFIDTVTSALKKGNEVALVGFGTFSVSRRKARKGRNPQDGSPLNIKAKNVPRFKAGKSLKSAVNR